MRVLVLTVVLSASALFASDSSSAAKNLPPETAGIPDVPAAMNLAPDIPSVPKGKATVIGGAIRNIDRLQDRLTLAVYGGKDMKIFFDQRTQVFRDGQSVALNELKPGERISVETLLDGELVFARSIHALTQSLDGECHGQVISYDRASGEMLVRDGLAPDAVKVRIPAGATIVGKGQETASAASLGPGALVAVSFVPDGNGHAVARQVSILAEPGSAFVFSGTVSYLDLHSGVMVVVDPRDQKRYEISFDPRTSVRASLREGIGVTVTAGFDGRQYSAKQIQIDPTASPQQPTQDK
jgi:hypothetical protein